MGDGDTRLLTARELARPVCGSVGHFHLLEGIHHAILPLRRARAAIRQRQLDVLIHGEIADHVEALKDEADLAMACARAIRVPELRDRAIVARIVSVGRGVEQTKHRQQG